MLHQTLPILGQLWQLFEVSQILEFLRYCCFTSMVNSYGHIAMVTNELGHMTNMAAMPIYGKNLKKSSSPETIDP